MNRIDIPGGWYLIRDDRDGNHKGCWFLSTPDKGDDEGSWVAHFWDGPDAGEHDVRAFARALGIDVPSMPETT